MAYTIAPIEINTRGVQHALPKGRFIIYGRGGAEILIFEAAKKSAPPLGKIF